MLLRTLLILFTASLPHAIRAFEYSEADFKADWSSPTEYEASQTILKWGTGATLFLVANRDNFSDQIQADIAQDKPLGELSKYGDYAGQLVPNLIYIGYHYQKGTPESNQRATIMFKASGFAGLTTFFLKRVFNQRRPSGDDRNSFPSGHTTTAFAFAGTIATQHPNWKIPAYALASLVGLSRMNDDAHYLHDVVMGATIGLSYAYAFSEKKVNTSALNTYVFPHKDGAMIGFNYLFE